MDNDQVVIRYPLLGKVLFALLSITFLVAGVFMTQIGGTIEIIIGVVASVFLGVGGLISVFVVAKRPIAVISTKGIADAYGGFVAWENVVKFEILEQRIAPTVKQRYIGVFANNAEESQSIIKRLTGWSQTPNLLINTDFSLIKREKVIAIMQRFYDKHKREGNHATNS